MRARWEAGKVVRATLKRLCCGKLLPNTALIAAVRATSEDAAAGRQAGDGHSCPRLKGAHSGRLPVPAALLHSSCAAV